MDTDRIGQLIKEIRQKAKMSQQQFADRYGVTYQAVSKWENGKNIPDIAILKQICKDYNLDLEKLLDEGIIVEKRKRTNLIPILIIIVLIIVIILLLNNKRSNDFSFKTLSSSCSNFTLYGSIAYNDSKSSIHISNITYCGGDDTEEYQSITCQLYESDGKINTLISKSDYEKEKPITLEEFFKNVSFGVDNYENKCKIYKENSLYLEIEAKKKDGMIKTYRIPLKLEDNCD